MNMKSSNPTIVSLDSLRKNKNDDTSQLAGHILELKEEIELLKLKLQTQEKGKCCVRPKQGSNK